MTLSENRKLGGWTGHTSFRGRDLELDIDAGLWEQGPQKAAESALEALDRRWREIETALLGHTLKLYNESWADSSQGFPALAAPAFLQKLSLASIAIGQGCVTLYFADGDLFAGHMVSVTVLEGQEPAAMLEG